MTNDWINRDGRIPEDKTGQKFGRLTAVLYAGRSSWHCRCDCGSTLKVKTSNLTNGHTLSCGCLVKEINSARAIHGHARNQRPTGTWHSWQSMLRRCFNSERPEYKDYGGRGITTCDRWLISFNNFLADMGDNPEGLSFGRKDNNGNYEPGNCKWENAEEQANNKRTNRLITIDGEIKTVSQWARSIGVNPDAIFCRLRRGASDHEAITKPFRVCQK